MPLTKQDSRTVHNIKMTLDVNSLDPVDEDNTGL